MQVPSESFSVSAEGSNGAHRLFLTGWLDASAVPELFHAVVVIGELLQPAPARGLP